MVKELGDFQRYLLEEFVEEWREGHMSRREMVRRAAYLTGGAASAATVLLSMGCAPAPTPTAVATKPAAAAPTSAPAVPTAAPAAASPTIAAVATKPTAATAAPSPAATGAASTAAAATKPAVAATAAASPAGASGAGSPTAGSAAKPVALPTSSPARSPLSVKEDDPAIDAKKVDFPGEAGKVFGYLARPKAPGSYAGVIVIHENRGLTAHIQDVVRRAAKEGFIALGVDLLSRQGGTDAVGDDARASGFLGQAKPEDLVADLGAGMKFLQVQDGFKKDKLGAVGFCFGGGYTFRLASANKALIAAVPFYGPPPPFDQLATTNAAVYAIYAEQDQRITSSVAQIEEALKKSGKPYEIKIFPGVGHAFHNDTGAAWNEKAAVEAWGNAMAWFKKYLA